MYSFRKDLEHVAPFLLFEISQGIYDPHVANIVFFSFTGSRVYEGMDLQRCILTLT